MLPIDALHDDVLAAIAEAPVVLSAPTGSGKSTQVPRWLPGRVLVVEPRRVACRALAARVADLEGARLGSEVGYVVRGDRRVSDSTRIVFATPGVVLRMLREGREQDFDALVLDEFHERSLDVDLILAIALQRGTRLLVMSATLDGDRLAEHVGGRHLRGEGRLYPVDIEHLEGPDLLPQVQGLEGRVAKALSRVHQGDVLVFLPGRGEIASVQAALQGRVDAELVPLHGGLSLDQQARALSQGNRRRVYLATNVAETSLTLPGIVAVIDSGLVRRTNYHRGRAWLALGPVAQDSADQRAGRAGRLGPGRCIRLWSARAHLEARTPPAVHRESLVPLVLAAAACDAKDLPFYDPPKDYALAAAQEELTALGALDGAGTLTERGGRLFAMPTDAWLGRLLAECHSRGIGSLGAALCASLDTRRRLFRDRPEDPADDLRAAGCDATAGIRAVWEGQGRHRLDHFALREAREAEKRFLHLLGTERSVGPIDRRALADALLAAWPNCAHIPRRRKKKVAWSNGGTELSLGRECAVIEEKAEALLVLDSRAIGQGRERRLMITAAMPVPLKWLAAANLGTDRMAGVSTRRGRVLTSTERVYAGKVLSTDERTPTGQFAREAIAQLILRGSLRRGLAKKLADRHALFGLAEALDGRRLEPLEDWFRARLDDSGLDHPSELSLLEDEDLLPPLPPPAARERIELEFPFTLSIGDASYRVSYDVARKWATFHQVGGLRKEPPPERFLPKLRGWKLLLERKNKVTTLRARR
ncbi:MAG: ATP-dependent RNA helicase [Deltaproteobacteria bacterium]|nr:ATP-dependent RNA helicase [Deltaproteobacteria bacterium]